MKKNFKKFALMLATGLCVQKSSAFCGFYVAKADAQLFNQASQVILVRDGNRSIITMSSDFKGDVKDFAMIVPVPEVLGKNDIRIANANIFSLLDAYSSPRLVEYYDNNPCIDYDDYPRTESLKSSAAQPSPVGDVKYNKDYKVTVEAKYTVGEYDIIILSAQDSGGLEEWLVDHGYKIPEKAKEVLEPYIKSNIKFFVVKVNLQEHSKTGYQELRPLQISFNSDKFMLPIRLGMANANGPQDLIVYSFTQKNKVECTNYRTTKIPSNKNIPLFVKNDFGKFYKDLFTTAWKREGKNIVFQEYSWDLSSSNFVKCDPCATTPPNYTDLREAGVFWVTQQTNNWSGSNYAGDVFFTRLHVRYDRSTFPQDLFFKQIPDRESFQGRYILQHPASGDINCENAQPYFKEVLNRREKELNELSNLTGWDKSKYAYYIQEYASKVKKNNNHEWFEPDQNSVLPIFINNNTPNNPTNIYYWILGLLIPIMFLYGWLFYKVFQKRAQ